MNVLIAGKTSEICDSIAGLLIELCLLYTSDAADE